MEARGGQVAMRKRKLQGEAVRQLNVVIRLQVYEKLKKIRGPHSLGAVIEELIVREIRRRDKRFIKTALDRDKLPAPQVKLPPIFHQH